MGIEELLGCNKIVFYPAAELHCKGHRISLKRGGSDIDSPDWMKSKKSTINSKNNYDNCFQYAVTVPLNHYKIKKDPLRIIKY